MLILNFRISHVKNVVSVVYVLIPAISCIGGFSAIPLESQILPPPQKNTQHTKNIKNASNLPPDMCFPQNLESRINTGALD